MSDNFKHTAGLQNVGSYQVSGKPFVTASTVTDGTEEQIEFPEVSNNITVKLDSSAGGGTNYNSLRLSGSLNLETDSSIFSTNGNEYSWSLWFSGSEEFITNRVNSTLLLAGFNHNSFGGAISLTNTQAFRFTFNHFQTGDPTNTGFGNPNTHPAYPKGWIFIVCGVFLNHATSVKGWIKIYYDHTYADNNTISQSGIENGNYYLYEEVNKSKSGGVTISNYTGTHAKIGSRVNTGNQPQDRFYRDLILWNGSIFSDTATLYNNGNYYDFNNYTTHEKLVWLKPDSYSLGTVDEGTDLVNFGISGSNWTNDTQSYSGEPIYNPGEIMNISGEAPFADVPGSGGELRVHYRPKGYKNVITGKHYWTLDSQNESITMNVKSKELYLSADGGDCDYSVEAELTNIPSSRMFQHTGSGVDE